MRTELKLAGFFRETHPFLIRGRHRSLPSFYDFVSEAQQEDESKIIRYLQNGKEHGYLSSRPIYKKPEDRHILDSTGFILTDGVWVWPSELAYYVEVFHLRVPPEFVSEMVASNWQLPSDIDWDTLVFPGAI